MTDIEIRKYAELMKELELTGLEINEQKGSIRLERNIGQAVSVAAPVVTQAAAPAVANTDIPKAAASNYAEIKSPIVGVFYQAPMENADPFVKVGDKVQKGDVVAIVEAMKLMNEITSDVDGVVKEVCVENGEAVDFGRVLFRIEEA